MMKDVKRGFRDMGHSVKTKVYNGIQRMKMQKKKMGMKWK